jgi:hypothetical protein
VQRRLAHTATLLSDGRVLVAGGSSTDTAEVYNPATCTWAATGSMSMWAMGLDNVT